MKYNATSLYAKPDDVVARNNQDGTFVVMKMDDSSIFYKIDGVAAQVWRGLLDGQSPQQLINSLGQEYEATPDQLQNDIENFVTQLLDKELLKAA